MHRRRVERCSTTRRLRAVERRAWTKIQQ